MRFLGLTAIFSYYGHDYALFLSAIILLLALILAFQILMLFVQIKISIVACLFLLRCKYTV